MSAEKGFYAILFLCLISFSFQDQQDNWTIYNNSIIINSYVSGLTEEERENYFYWVGLRNSFYFSEDSNQLEKLVKYFTPEEEDYYSNLFSFSVPFIICAAVVIVLFLVYLVKRFLLKGCRGPKIYTKSYDHVTYFFLITGFAVGFISLCVTIHNARKSK